LSAARSLALAGSFAAAILFTVPAHPAAGAETFAPYSDGLTWRFRCTPQSGVPFDLTETFHARASSGALHLFTLTIARNGGAPAPQSVHGVDDAGNGYLAGTFVDGTLRALNPPAMILPATPAPGFSVQFSRGDEAVTRHYVNTVTIRRTDGKAVRAVVFSDETGAATTSSAYAPGLGLVLSNAAPKNGTGDLLCERQL
jgi:hypothetical protein